MGNTITLTIMDRSGHSEETVDFESAAGRIQEEMERGKWLRVVRDDGTSFIETDVNVVSSKLEVMKDTLLSAKSVTLTMALLGGESAGIGLKRDIVERQIGLIQIDGVWYRRTDVIKTEGPVDADTARKADVIAETDALNDDDDDETTACCAEFDGSSESFRLVVVNDPDAPIVEADTSTVILNNAFGQEACAETLAKIMVAVEDRLPELMAGEAVIGETVHEDDLD